MSSRSRPTLLGAVVTHGGVSVRLTEVEAYAGAADPGRTPSSAARRATEVMFGPPGRLYVYFTYGMHFCANVVTGPEGSGLRGPAAGGGGRRRPRARRGPQTPGSSERDLARGPARLAVDPGAGPRAQRPRPRRPARRRAPVPPPVPVDPRRVRTGPRVGVSGAGGDGSAYPWRFWLDGEPTVSPYRPGRPRGTDRT